MLFSTSPRLRGEVKIRDSEFWVRGPSASPEFVETALHPDLLPASGEKEK